MTDLSRWDELIKRASAPGTTADGYIMLPFDEYKMGNLLGLLKRSTDKDNGDWFDELIATISTAMHLLHIKELHSNFGDTFRQGSLWEQVHQTK